VRNRISSILAGTLVLLACNSTTTQDDTVYPACNGVSPEGLATEATSAGACPAHPKTLVGTATVGSPCGQSTDCQPYCCQCPNGGSSDAAECSNGNCLDGDTTCCLFAAQCSN
jgi:hypothetical protein